MTPTKKPAKTAEVTIIHQSKGYHDFIEFVALEHDTFVEYYKLRVLNITFKTNIVIKLDKKFDTGYLSDLMEHLVDYMRQNNVEFKDIKIYFR